MDIKEKSGRVILINGFVVDIDAHLYNLKSGISYNEATNSEGVTTIVENCKVHGHFGSMQSVINRLHKLIVEQKLQEFQRSVEFVEYVNIVKETNKILENFSRLIVLNVL